MMNSESYPVLKLLVGGEWIADTGRTTDVFDPATGEIIATLPSATGETLRDAVSAAAQAFPKWKAMSARDRGAILAGAARLLRSRSEGVALNLVRDNGKPLSEARLEVAGAADILDWFAEEGKRAYGRTIPSRQPNSRLFTQREPIGSVALFMAWNYPGANFVRKVAPALAAGCTIVAKPAEETPSTALAIAQCLMDAGLPAGVLNVVHGHPPTVSNFILPHPDIKKISFTGSTGVGRELARLAGQYLKRSTMELGGHSPLIVCEDVDVDHVVTLASAFKFRNAGQICTSPTRFYVHDKIHAEFTKLFAARANALRVGSGLLPETTMGPLTHVRRQSAMQNFIENARNHGARVHCGGEAGHDRGYFFQPTILTDVGAGAAILSEEPFGPIVPIIRFTEVEEAIRQANDSPYGLAAFAFTRDLSKARLLANDLEAGQVCINNFIPSLPETPAGGFKDSGWGQENGIEGMDPYLNNKFVHEMS